MKRKMFSYGCCDAAALFCCVAEPLVLPLARCRTSDIAASVCFGVSLDLFIDASNCLCILPPVVDKSVYKCCAGSES